MYERTEEHHDRSLERVDDLFPPDSGDEHSADEVRHAPDQHEDSNAFDAASADALPERDPGEGEEAYEQPLPLDIPVEPEGQPVLEGSQAADSPDDAPAPETDVSSEQAPEPISLPTGELLAIVNQKGGVGKTTTTISLGAALVEEGARVLLVDFDPQGALSVGLGIEPNSLDLTIHNLLFDHNLHPDEVIRKSKVEGLDLVPSNIDLSVAEMMLVSEVARERSLARALEPVRDRYNYILVDCPPSLGLLTVNALTAADGVLIPLECEYFALRGMKLLNDTVEMVKERLNPQLEIKGILATMFDSRTIHGREVLSRVTDAFGDKLFKTIIHKTIRFAEAPVAGEPILTYAPRSAGAQEYRDLAREVMSR